MLYIDFSDSSMTVIQTAQNLFGSEMPEAYAHKDIEEGLIINGLIADAEKLTAEFRELLVSAYPKAINGKKASILISDKQALVHRFLIPTANKQEDISMAVIEEAKKVLPYDPSELENFYKILSAGSDRSEVLYAAMPKTSILNFAQFLQRFNLKLSFLTPKSFALHHLLEHKFTDKPIIFCETNKKNEYFLFDKSGLVLFEEKKSAVKSLPAETKAFIKHIQTEKNIILSEVIIGGNGSIEVHAKELEKEIELPVEKSGEILEAYLTKIKMNLETGGIAKLLFFNALGLLLLSHTSSPPNFAKDLDFSREAKAPSAPVASPPIVPQNQTQDLGILGENKSSGKLKRNILILIIPIILLIIVAAAILFSKNKKINIQLPFMISPTVTPTMTPVPTITPTPTIDTTLKRSDLNVEVQNGTDKSGYAKDMAAYLEGKGYKNVAKSNADADTYETTVIKIKEAKKKYIPLLASDLSSKVDTKTVQTLDDKDKYDVVVILGKK